MLSCPHIISQENFIHFHFVSKEQILFEKTNVGEV